MAGIKLFIVFSMTALHLSIMSGCVRTNEFVADAELRQGCFKQCGLIFLVCIQTIGKLHSIIRLDAFDGIGELLNHILDELC